MIYYVYSYFKSLENCEEKVNVFFRDTQKITAESCGVSLRTLLDICHEVNGSVISNPISLRPILYISTEKYKL